ncbi:MAG: ribonuclease P protein component [Dehalococcoidia bacterium]|nr:ribonuclease P protein component [Dehalococcoidia bacterium]
MTRRADFARVYREGRSWANSLLVLRALHNGLPCNRYGLVVSKSVGGAVVRNLLKRRLRESLRVMSLRQGWDVVCIARSGSASANYPRLKQALDELLGRARFLERRL